MLHHCAACLFGGADVRDPPLLCVSHPTHVLRLCMPTQTYTMPTIRASTSPTCTATIPLVHLPISRPTAQPSTSSPQPSASPSGPNAPAIVAAAASRPARPISNRPSNTATTNLKPPSKSKSSNRPSLTAILAWIGTGLAVAGVILTIFYGKLTMHLAHWTAGNDYRESCRNDRDDGVFLDEKCKEALGHPPKPPPIRKREVLPLNDHHIWGVPIWILATGCVLLVLLLLALLLLYKTKGLPIMPRSPASEKTPHRRRGPREFNYPSDVDIIDCFQLFGGVYTLKDFYSSFSAAHWTLYDTNNHIDWTLVLSLLTATYIFYKVLRWMAQVLKGLKMYWRAMSKVEHTELLEEVYFQTVFSRNRRLSNKG